MSLPTSSLQIATTHLCVKSAFLGRSGIVWVVTMPDWASAFRSVRCPCRTHLVAKEKAGWDDLENGVMAFIAIQTLLEELPKNCHKCLHLWEARCIVGK